MDAASILNVVVQALDAALIAFLVYGAYLAYRGGAGSPRQRRRGVFPASRTSADFGERRDEGDAFGSVSTERIGDRGRGAMSHRPQPDANEVGLQSMTHSPMGDGT